MGLVGHWVVTIYGGTRYLQGCLSCYGYCGMCYPLGGHGYPHMNIGPNLENYSVLVVYFESLR